MKTQITSPDLTMLCQLLSDHFGGSGKFYGEGNLIITEGEGANYQSISTGHACSVDDNYDVVYFLVRESSSPTDQTRGGNQKFLSRKTTFKLVGNAKSQMAEFDISVLINKVPGIEYQGSNFDGKTIASTYFGIQEYNFETFFFTIDFTVLEKIICTNC